MPSHNCLLPPNLDFNFKSRCNRFVPPSHWQVLIGTSQREVVEPGLKVNGANNLYVTKESLKTIHEAASPGSPPSHLIFRGLSANITFWPRCRLCRAVVGRKELTENNPGIFNSTQFPGTLVREIITISSITSSEIYCDHRVWWQWT